tara:strand:+ start:371 stop:640 length:270 start_codon:yes stop_codon:yes gene_type:complete
MTHKYINELKENARTIYIHKRGGMNMQERIDKALGKWASRKLIVWATSTVFLAMGTLTSSDWVAVSLAYIGLQGAADIAATWKHGSSNR